MASPQDTHESAARPSDIAIIGMACRMPQADDLDQFWHNLLNKVDAIEEIPADRWDWRLYFNAERQARDKVYSKWGGFMRPAAFDPTQYGMPPNAVPSVEPMQLLVLDVVRKAIEDAGYKDRPFNRERACVVVGAGGGVADLGNGYGVRSLMPQYLAEAGFAPDEAERVMAKLNATLPEWTEDSFAGILMNVVAGRVANRFDLGGTNFTVDAACASSLAAVRLAVNELETHSSDVAIVGGADTMQSPFAYLCFSKTQALSPTGRCKTFDAEADGIVTSEGIAFVVLKRLADAERDGDRIYAVIKAVGSSSDGKDKGLTAPRPAGQMRAMERAFQKAGIAANTIGLIEAHGTGTVAGDRSEMESVSKVMAAGAAAPQSCAMGSVKSLIGHTKCTAGVAGLVKAALSLHHKLLPATINVKTPNPAINGTPLYVNAETRPWVQRPDGTPRRAGVSSFGFGGTNFHAIMEEYVGAGNGHAGNGASPACAIRAWQVELFVWRGASAGDVVSQAEKLVAALTQGAQPALTDLAAAVCTAAESGGGDCRLAIAAGSLAELREKIGHAATALKDAPAKLADPRGIWFSAEPMAGKGKIAFLFPGQGSQRVNMLRDLAAMFGDVRARFETADRTLFTLLEQPLSRFVFPPPRFTEQGKAGDEEALTQTRIAQPAMGAADVAMFDVLTRLGIRPDMAAGHSYGEYAALCAAGVVSYDDLLRISEARGRAISDVARSNPGAMAAVDGDEDAVTAALSGCADVIIANLNSPKQTVISGTEAGIEAAAKVLAAKGLTARRIKVSCAFHSPWVAAAQAPLAAAMAPMRFDAPSFAVYSNTTAAPHEGDGASIRARLVDHLVRPVRFVEQICRMHDDGARVFIEVGPGGTMSALTERCLEGRDFVTVATDQPSRHGLASLVYSLGALAVAGVQFSAAKLFEGRVQRRLELDKLVETTRPAALPPTTWMVTGTKATPISGKKAKPAIVATATVEAKATVATAAPSTISAPPHSAAAISSLAASSAPPSRMVTASAPPAAPLSPFGTNGAAAKPAAPAFGAAQQPPVMAASAFAPPAPSMFAPAPAAAPVAAAQSVIATPMVAANDAVDSVIGDFQRLMSRFLDTQKSVMLAYLQGGPAAPAAPQLAAHSTMSPVAPVAAPIAPVAVAPPMFAPAVPPALPPRPAAPAQAIAAPRPAAVAAPAAPPPVAAPQPAAVSADQLLAQLTAVVSERTGYPPEMLNPDLDLEADLGIDSIKRVEILGTLRSGNTLSAASAEGAMESLSKLKTLRAIVDWIVTQAGTQPADAAVAAPAVGIESAPAAAAPAAPGITRERLVAHLVKVVSDRTGYPPEMLDLNLDLEADLGIDSIKRVEILGTLRSEAVLPADSADGAMEQLAKLKSLNAIIAWILERAAQSPAAPISVAAPAANTASVARAVAPAPTSGVTRERLVDHLVRVVSERTGYPPEMLNLDLDLEADLGIDSIKRVEILGTLRSDAMLPAESAEGAMEQLAKLKTLNAIVNWIVERAAAAPSPAQPDAATKAPEPATTTAMAANAGKAVVGAASAGRSMATALPRMTLSVRDVRSDVEPPLTPAGVIVITDDESGVAHALASGLRSRGIASVRVAARRRPEENGDVVRVDLTDTAAVKDFIAAVQRDHGRIAGLVHLLPLAADEVCGAADPARWDAALQMELLGLVHLSQQAEADLREGGDGIVITATRMDGAFGAATAARPGSYWHGHAVAGGIVKSLAREWSEVRCRSLDFAPDMSKDDVAEALAAAVVRRGGPVEIGHAAGRRKLLLPTAAPLSTETESIRIGADDVVLITGGARGITAEVAIELAQRFGPTLVLVGRSQLPAEQEPADTAGVTGVRELKAALAARIAADGTKATPALIEAAYRRLLSDRDIRASIAAMKAAGSTVHYVAADVADPAAFAEAVDSIYARFGRIDGVIHAAGVTEDKFLRDKTDESFRRVIAPKVNGATVLADKLRGDRLKFLLFFSSVSARYGNRGQCDYSAANEFMNKLAIQLNARWPARVASLNWGPWESTGGMVSAELAEQFAKSGVRIISRAEGRVACVDEILHGRKDEVEVVFGGPLTGPDADHAEPQGSPRALLTGRASESRLADGSLEIELELDPARDLYLMDHQLDGRPVMPAAMVLELLAEAASIAHPEQPVTAIRDLKVLNGVVFENGPRRVRATVGPLTSTSGLASAAVRLDICGDRPRPCYSGTAEFGQPSAATARPELLLSNVRPLELSIDEAYERWLFHGPLFAGIDAVDALGENGIVARLSPSLPRRCLAESDESVWLFDPVIVDSGLQMMILWARTFLDATPLPAKFGRMRRFDRPWSGPIRCEVSILKSDDTAIEADLAFRDQSGVLVGLLEGMEVTCSKALNRLAGRAMQKTGATGGGQA